MELRDIAVFVQVAEDGDFSAAARTLALTPSTISKSIVELFHGQQMAAIVSDAAIKNPRSIGAHFRAD